MISKNFMRIQCFDRLMKALRIVSPNFSLECRRPALHFLSYGNLTFQILKSISVKLESGATILIYHLYVCGFCDEGYMMALYSL